MRFATSAMLSASGPVMGSRALSCPPSRKRVHRPAMASDTNDEGATNTGRDARVRDEPRDVEHRTRGMLSVHRRDPLAAVRVIEREILPRH